jgi:flagellar hook-length control protein FliK
VLQPLTGPSRPDASAAAPGAQGLAPQLARPILTLAGASPGQHVLTIRVTPENLGPVTVQAHIGADGVRIELFAPTEVGRAAVQAVLADLRRDLAGTGLGASLDLSDRGAPSHDPAAREDRNHGGAQAGRSQGTGPAPHLAADEPRPVRPALPTALSAIRLDIFA